MATETIVFTYDVGVVDGTGEKGVNVTSFTVGGTAYASLTAAQQKKASVLLRSARARLVADGKHPSTSDRADATA